MTDLPAPSPIIIRYLGLVSLAMLVGGFAFVCLILPPSLLSREGYQILERHLRRVQAGSILIVAVTSVADLIMRTLAMSGGTPATLGATLPMVLQHTHFGTVWIVRILLLGLLGVAWWLQLQGAAIPSRFAWVAGIPRLGLLSMTWWLRLLGTTASRQFAWVSFFGACFVALTTTLSGHAADWGDVSVPALVDWFHILAVSVWIGGLFTFGFVLKRSLATPNTDEMLRALSSIARRFSRIAAGCVALFLLTGVYNTWLQVGVLPFIVTSTYGWTLLVKVSLITLILIIAAVNRCYFLPLLASHASRRRDHPALGTNRRPPSTPEMENEGREENRIRYRFSRFVRLEWIIVMIVLACSALLTQLPPARHVHHIEHLKSHEHNGGHPPTHEAPTAMPPSLQR